MVEFSHTSLSFSSLIVFNDTFYLISQPNLIIWQLCLFVQACVNLSTLNVFVHNNICLNGCMLERHVCMFTYSSVCVLQKNTPKLFVTVHHTARSHNTM